jgi:hypothetical protein
MLPDDDQNKILALQAEMAQMIKGFKHAKHGSKQPRRKNMGKGNGNEIEKWKVTPPRSGENRSKVRDEKTYSWSPNHNMWTIHPIADCRLGKGKETTKKHSSKGKNQRGFALKAYQALMEDEEDEEEPEASDTEAEQSEGEGSYGSSTSE